MKIYAKIKTILERTHRWEKCNLKDVKFLKYPHHHIFEIVVFIEQFHTQRDIEYLTFKKWLDERLTLLKFDNDSCEIIAKKIKEIIVKKYPGRELKIEVLEDGHYGATIDYQQELNWLAGIIDGEGSIYITKKRNPVINITNTNEAIIDECFKIAKCFNLKTNKKFIENKNKKRMKEDWKLAYRFAITGKNNVLNALNLIESYLIGKKMQSKILRTYLERVECRKPDFKQFNKIYTKLSLLNKKGL